ncbi:MAG TPA: CHRD domain-containing protein [Candidatus Angelobacter sp.]|nr:CHRD domain-containing protein [Candidatus Angelobacter sp.]
MKKLCLIVLAVFCLGIMGAASDNDDNTLRASLRGVNETPGPVSTQATGSFHATLSADGTTLNYTVTFSNLNAPITQSHIHFGLPRETGGIMVWLCQTAAAPAPATDPGVPTCPGPTSGTVTGTINVANVVGPNSQGITPGADFNKVVQAIRAGTSYVNVHSSRSPGGEIRGVVHVGDDDRRDRD